MKENDTILNREVHTLTISDQDGNLTSQTLKPGTTVRDVINMGFDKSFASGYEPGGESPMREYQREVGMAFYAEDGSLKAGMQLGAWGEGQIVNPFIGALDPEGPSYLDGLVSDDAYFVAEAHTHPGFGSDRYYFPSGADLDLNQSINRWYQDEQRLGSVKSYLVHKEGIFEFARASN